MSQIVGSPILCVVGARPNFMKIAPVIHALRTSPYPLPTRLVHTGQHYDVDMKDTFFSQLGIPEPDVDLGVGSGSHAVQTAEIMRRFEPVIDETKPAAVLVVGDVNSTLACALVASKKGIPVIHVEAGLRSFDRTMPEEINRVLTDQIAELLFITEKAARQNLLNEGIDERRIHFVGNVMIDTLKRSLQASVRPETTLRRYRASSAVFDGGKRAYGVLTLHRPSNVDDAIVLKRLLEILGEISERVPLVFPVHPRTRARIEAMGLGFAEKEGILMLPPIGYLEMLGLMSGAKLVLTDSGGMQEETTALGVPCLTLRENTERPVTVEEGTNTVVGSNPALIRSAVVDLLTTAGKTGRVPPLWDGKASMRIKDVLLRWLREGEQRAI